MIEGIGIDIAEISRIRASLERFGDRFKERVFTEREITYCEALPDPAMHYAAVFAAKEAFVKALGELPAGDMKLIEVVRNAAGKPSLELHGAALTALGGAKSVHVSLTHDGPSAAAVAIIETTV